MLQIILEAFLSSRSNIEDSLLVRPNQSLKLTEVAVDDFAARQKIFKGKAMSAARIVYKELAARRRSLAPVR